MSAFVCGLGGAVLIASALWHWGTTGVFSGVAILLAGCAWFLRAVAEESGPPVRRCPNCSAPSLRGEELAKAPATSCRSCGVYVRRFDHGQVDSFPADHEAPEAIFEAPLPFGDIHWATGCAVCGQTPCELEPVGSVLSAPLCQRHRETGAILVARSRFSERVVVKFRSHRAARRFGSLNPAA